VRDANRRARGYEVGEGKFVHEIVQEPTIFYAVGGGNVERIGIGLLGFDTGSGDRESGE
jgi:hypothetical protein